MGSSSGLSEATAVGVATVCKLTKDFKRESMCEECKKEQPDKLKSEFENMEEGRHFRGSFEELAKTISMPCCHERRECTHKEPARWEPTGHDMPQREDMGQPTMQIEYFPQWEKGGCHLSLTTTTADEKDKQLLDKLVSQLEQVESACNQVDQLMQDRETLVVSMKAMARLFKLSTGGFAGLLSLLVGSVIAFEKLTKGD